MITLITFYLVSHFVSFVCSILEAALLCCTRGYLALLKKTHHRAAQLVEAMKDRIDRPLAAILTLNTAAHTIGAAGVGAYAAEIFGEHSLFWFSALLTCTMLFFTEMIPKTLGALYWKSILPYAAFLIQGLIWITLPFVWVFEGIGKKIARGKTVDRITGEEIKSVLQEGTQAGVIQALEHEMLESIFRLGNRRVGVLMVPRMEIEWLDLRATRDDVHALLRVSPHSRFPVCDRTLNNVMGLIGSKELLLRVLNSESLSLEAGLKAPLFVPETMRVVQLLELFRKTTDQIALVIDEYGGVQGLITLHDVLESIVGEVPSSDITPGMQIVQRKDGSWLIDGMLPTDEFKEEFHIDALPDEDKGYYRTVGGFCMRQLGVIPTVGESFVWGEYCFRVIRMEGRRVERILLTPVR